MISRSDQYKLTYNQQTSQTESKIFSFQKKRLKLKNSSYRKQQARQNARDEETTKLKLAIKETTPIPINKASYTFGAIKEDARIRVEQDSDPVFKAIKRKLICEEHDKHLLQTDTTAKRLLVHENRLIVKNGVLMHKYYGECGLVTHHQILIPEHLITELLKAFHGQMGKLTGFTKTIQE